MPHVQGGGVGGQGAHVYVVQGGHAAYNNYKDKNIFGATEST